MIGWSDYQLNRWSDDQTISWSDDRMIRLSVDQMIGWSGDQVTNRPGDWVIGKCKSTRLLVDTWGSAKTKDIPQTLRRTSLQVKWPFCVSIFRKGIIITDSPSCVIIAWQFYNHYYHLVVDLPQLGLSGLRTALCRSRLISTWKKGKR